MKVRKGKKLFIKKMLMFFFASFLFKTLRFCHFLVFL